MKKILLAIMGLIGLTGLVSCEKENSHSGENQNRDIFYTVTEETGISGFSGTTAHLTTEAEWDALLDQFCNQAQAGSEVVFYNMSQTTYLQSKGNGSSTSNRTINTTSREEMKKWMKDMEKQGLTVRVTYNDSTRTWHGEAYATAPTTDTDDNLIGTWRFNCMVVTQTDRNDHLLSSDLFAPEEGSTMYYSFYNDGTLTITIVNSIDSVSDSGTWTLSDNGELCSEMMPNGVCWNVSWITSNSMILSHSNLGTEEGNYFYQLQFDAVSSEKK